MYNEYNKKIQKHKFIVHIFKNFTISTISSLETCKLRLDNIIRHYCYQLLKNEKKRL